MRSARILLATAAASAALALGAGGAYAAGGDSQQDGSSSSSGRQDSSYSKEHGKEHGSGYEKEHGGKDEGYSHDGPRGGMHTGGGALTLVNQDDWGTARDPKQDPETYKKDSSGSDSGQDSWGGKHESPRGGMHTGGGALAAPTVTAGGLAVVAVAGAGLYAARRKRSAAGMA
ncbi:hypothetical protein [Streptomyces griseosporeus]